MHRMALAPSLLIALLIFGTSDIASAQGRSETLELRNGSAVSGEIVEVGADRMVIAKGNGSGGARRTLLFADIAPESLYAVMASSLAPLDRHDHLRIADAAAGAGLYATAIRHWSAAIEAGGSTDDIDGRIRDAREKDIEKLLVRSQEEVERERFSTARRFALMVMERYPDHEVARSVPERLEAIAGAYQEAQRRDAALESSRRAKENWERGERALANVEKWIIRAKEAEQGALKSTAQFRASVDTIDGALRHLRNAEDAATALHQSRLLPHGLRQTLFEMEEEIIDLHIRMRLHAASLYTVRGSYGTALAYVNAALAYNPKDEQALAARARVEESAAVSSARIFTRGNR